MGANSAVSCIHPNLLQASTCAYNADSVLGFPRQTASLVVFGDPQRFDQRWRDRRRAIHQAPIFPAAPSSASTSASDPAACRMNLQPSSQPGQRPAEAAADLAGGSMPGSCRSGHGSAGMSSRPAAGAQLHSSRSKASGLTLSKRSSLGLQSAGVLKRRLGSSLVSSKAGSKHALSQAGKLSRIRLGAKLVLGDVPM